MNANSVLLLEVDSNLQQQNVKQPLYILQIDDIPCIDSWLLPSPPSSNAFLESKRIHPPDPFDFRSKQSTPGIVSLTEENSIKKRASWKCD